MLAYDSHPQIAPSSILAILSAVLLGEVQSKEAGFVGESARFCEQGFPFWPREAAVVPVCAGVLAPVVEEAVVVVAVLQGEDLVVDELV